MHTLLVSFVAHSITSFLYYTTKFISEKHYNILHFCIRFVTTRENFNIRLYVRQLENITKVEQNVK